MGLRGSGKHLRGGKRPTGGGPRLQAACAGGSSPLPLRCAASRGSQEQPVPLILGRKGRIPLVPALNRAHLP
jgi:hypothetical protein